MEKIEAGHASAVERHDQALRENTLGARVTNALLLAQSMSVDISDPVMSEKVLRYLRLVERRVSSDFQ